MFLNELGKNSHSLQREISSGHVSFDTYSAYHDPTRTSAQIQFIRPQPSEIASPQLHPTIARPPAPARPLHSLLRGPGCCVTSSCGPWRGPRARRGPMPPGPSVPPQEEKPKLNSPLVRLPLYGGHTDCRRRKESVHRRFAASTSCPSH